LFARLRDCAMLILKIFPNNKVIIRACGALRARG
jgi:hypothetical protein